MDERYDTYCDVDPLFYDSLSKTDAATEKVALFARAAGPVPPGWKRESSNDWMVYGPAGHSLPDQGWKVHVSACLDNAVRVLDRTWDYCVQRGLSFKFIRSPRLLMMRNAKYAHRGSSGKFITIYPRDEAELELVCKELAELLDGEPGPYILSDLRYGDGPLYVRYGGFASRFCLSDGGQVVPAIADETGTLVPDRRDPVFHVPSWVTMPDFLTPQLAARNATTTTNLPYRIEQVIHFSNGGGLYVGRDTRTDTKVVLKEARPHAGLDASGTDAVTRLSREAEMLRRLEGLQVPRVHDEFALGDHQFLACEFIEGRPLNKVIVQRYPLVDANATAADRAAYATWALHVYEQVEKTLDAIHERGIVYGDLHLFNIMVQPDDTVALVDFEVAAPVEEGRRPALGNQGFAAPRGWIGFPVDRYALACLRLALFLPLTQLLRLAPAKAADLASVIATHFPVPPEFLERAVAEIAGAEGQPTADPPPNWASLTTVGAPDGEETDALPHQHWHRLRQQLAAAITASATPERDDRLFPGDIKQFQIDGGLNLGYGAAGVLHVLSATGAGTRAEHEEWLVKRALNPSSGTRPGFYDGLHGVAYALEHLGRRQEALDVLDICLGEPWEELSHDLVSGLSGIALNLAELAGRTGEPALRTAAWRATELVAAQVSADDTGAEISGGQHPYAGLTRGHTGPALMFVRMYELTGEAALLDYAATALRRDLRRCVVRDTGTMEVNEGWRTMPYLAHGSVGIGLVLDQYLAHRPDEEFAKASTAIRNAARAPFYAQSGLFAGRAGIIAYLTARAKTPSRAGTSDDRAADRKDLADQVRRLGWHALPYRDGLAFPGEQLLRLSMDLATGTAGVLLALGSALHDKPVTLPFFTPLTGAAKLPSQR